MPHFEQMSENISLRLKMITVAVGLKVGYRKVRIGNRKVTEVLLQQSSWEAMAAWGE